MAVLKRTVLIMALILIIPAVLFAGGSTEKETASTDEYTIRLGLWGAEAAINAYTKNAAECETVYPGVKIEMQPYPSSQEFWNTLPAQIAAKTAPDILQLTNEGAYEYIKKGLFVPIGDVLEKEGLSLDEFAGSAKEIWTVDGQLYGIPLSVGPGMFFINVDMWKEAGLGEYPTTWEEVRAAARVLTNADRHGLIININAFHFTNYALSHGGGWGNGATINSDANIKAMELVVDMFEEGIATSPKQAGYGWDGEVFANRKGAMTTGGHWYKAFLANAAPDLNWVALPMPQGGAKGCTSHSEAIVVLKDAVDKTAAVKAAYYIAREASMEVLMKEASINPARPKLSAQYYDVNPEFKPAQPMIPYAKDFGYPAETKRFIDELVKAMEEKIIAGSDQSVKAVLDGLQQRFN